MKGGEIMISGVIIDALKEGKAARIVTTVPGIEYKVKKLISETKYLITFETSNKTVYLIPSQVLSVEITERGGRVL